MGDLPRPSCESPVLFPAELSRSSWLSLMAFIPPERYLSLELQTGLTSWTQLCSGRAGMLHPTLPPSRVVPWSSSGSDELDCVPTTFPPQRLFLKRPPPWLVGKIGSQEEASAYGCSSSTRYHCLLSPRTLIIAPASEQITKGAAVAPNCCGGRNWSPQACSAELPLSLSSCLRLAHPGAGLCICCYWISHGSCQSISPACPQSI